MATNVPQGSRARLGKLLLASAGLMFAIAAAIWYGWIPVVPEGRTSFSLVLVVAGAIDALIALRFMAE